MITVDEALTKILNSVVILEPEEKIITDCLDQVASDNIKASFNIPVADNSAMDGYALKAADIKSAKETNPIFLKVIGEIPAGVEPKVRIEKGQCVKIMTGAIIPIGADVVVPIELTDIDNRKKPSDNENEIGIFVALPKGTNIRNAGEDITRDQLVIKTGDILHPAEIGMLASLGIGKVNVFRRPIVSLLATGNEIIDVGTKLVPGKLYNSNSYALAAQVRKYGGIPKIIGIAQDNIGNLTGALKNGIDSDLIITTGGVSVGDYDIVKEALTLEGEMSFWQVRIKPGKPIAFGIFNMGEKKIPHLGLPGNPVSCMIGFEIFGRPAILKMMGKNDYSRNVVTAVMDDEVINDDNRRIYARVIISRIGDIYHARLSGAQGSAVIMSMVKANGLAVIPENNKKIDIGDKVEVIILNSHN
jgi:molybdopterin molybdotransferase